MSKQARPSKSPLIRNNRCIVASSLAAAFAVFASALLLQWAVYDGWLHDRGPLRVVGSLVAALLTFAFSCCWQDSARSRQLHALRRDAELRDAHDRVRNSLQTIECVTYARAPDTTEPVRNAVDLIEKTLVEAFRAAAEAPRPAPLPLQLPHRSRSGPEAAPPPQPET
jgi:hypothetical protein